MSTTSIIPTLNNGCKFCMSTVRKVTVWCVKKSDSISLRFLARQPGSSKRLGGFLNANHLELSRAGGCLAIYSTGLMNAKNHGF